MSNRLMIALVPLSLALGCALFQVPGDEQRVQVDVRPDDPSMGPPTAPVKVIFFADFQ